MNQQADPSKAAREALAALTAAELTDPETELLLAYLCGHAPESVKDTVASIVRARGPGSARRPAAKEAADKAHAVMDATTLNPGEIRHVLLFLCGWTPDGVTAAIGSIQRARAWQAEDGDS